MKPYKVNIVIMSRGEEGEILDKQILVDNLEDLFIVENNNGTIANRNMYEVVKEALKNEKEDGLDFEAKDEDTYDGSSRENIINAGEVFPKI